ncbi:hypothetical protein [Natrarchaeobius chitinivorans]|nr:hypothetical protein [Natrarchaeobius chitinivorans]
MVERFRRREDVDGCACLECRAVTSGAIRRGVGDVLLWSVGFLRKRPSVPLVFLALGLVQVLGYVGPFGLELAASGLVFFGAIFARGYAITIVSGELADRRYTPKTAAGHTLRRLPAVIATMIGTFVATMGVMFVGVFVGIGVLVSDNLVLSALGTLGLLVLFVLFIVVVVKFVLAPEAVVAGGYGPIAALRVSWELVSFRRRTTIALIGLVIAVVTTFALGEIGAAAEPYPVVGSDTASAVVFGGSSVLTYLSSAVTSFVLCHVYVQGVLE